MLLGDPKKTQGGIVGKSITGRVLAAALLFLPLLVQAAGLGNLKVLSALGQPLNAQIEIVSEQTDEWDSFTAHLASQEAFGRAGIDFNPVLLGLTINIERLNGKAVLYLRTKQPVNEPFLDMLIELHKELRERGVRLVLTRMIMATRQVLERADTKHEIDQSDIFHSLIQAYTDYFVSESGEDSGHALLRFQLLETREVLQARMSVVPGERKATLAAVLDIIDKELKQLEGG